MADAIESAWVEIVPDFQGFKSSAEAEMTNILGPAGGAAGIAGSGRFGSSFLGGLGRLAGPIVGAIAALGIAEGIGDAIKSGVEFGLDSIDIASAFQQSSGAVDAIFGPASATIHNFATNADRDLGLSANSYNELASVLGAQLKNGGVAIDQVGAKTSDLIKLGSDLSAQFGGTTQDAVESLSSALRGERDPIEKYGVSLTQNAINAKAAALGFQQVNGTLSTQANQVATLAIVYDQTQSAQGQFAAQTDTLAEKQQIFQAQLENVKTSLGNSLLPAATAFVGFASTTLIPAFQQIVDKVGPELSKAFTDNGPAIQQLLTQLVPLATQLIELGVSVLPIVIQAAELIVPLLQDWASNMTFVNTIVKDFFGLLAGNTTLKQLGADLANASGSLASVDRWIAQVNASIGQFIAKAAAAGKAIVDGIVNGIRNGIGAAGKAISDVMKEIGKYLPHSPAEKGPFSGSGWSGVAGAGAAIREQFQAGLNGNVDMQFGAIGANTVAGSSVAASPTGDGGAAFVNRGIIQVTDEKALLAEVDKKQRRANAFARVGTIAAGGVA